MFHTLVFGTNMGRKLTLFGTYSPKKNIFLASSAEFSGKAFLVLTRTRIHRFSDYGSPLAAAAPTTVANGDSVDSNTAVTGAVVLTPAVLGSSGSRHNFSFRFRIPWGLLIPLRVQSHDFCQTRFRAVAALATHWTTSEPTFLHALLLWRSRQSNTKCPH
jgi:hypothetical protein